MKVYEVGGSIIVSITAKVQANTEDEALDIASTITCSTHGVRNRKDQELRLDYDTKRIDAYLDVSSDPEFEEVELVEGEEDPTDDDSDVDND